MMSICCWLVVILIVSTCYQLTGGDINDVHMLSVDWW